MIDNKIADIVCRLNTANTLNERIVYITYKPSSSPNVHSCPTDIYDILNILAEESPQTFQYTLLYPNLIKITLNHSFKLLKVVSKPGRKKYVRKKDIRIHDRGFGYYILRTCKGIISSNTASNLNLGGEILIKCV